MMTPGHRINPSHGPLLTTLKARHRAADSRGAERMRTIGAGGSERQSVKSRRDEKTPGGGDDERRPRERFNEGVSGPIKVRSERDILRETFDTFAEGLCVVGAAGALEVSN